MTISFTGAKKLLLFSALLTICLLSSAQEISPTKRFTAFPFPLLYYSPETRIAYGVAGNATFRFQRDSQNVKPSNIVAGLAYTQNKQVLLYSQFQVFYDNNNYYFFGEAGYYKYSYYFYGIGKAGTPKELYTVNYPRIKLNAAYKILPHIYAGVSYQFENYGIKSIAPQGALASGNVVGSAGSTTSGAGPLLLYDSRDSVLYPGKGWFGNVSFMNNGTFLGGNFNFSRIVLDLNHYGYLSKKFILATNLYGSFVSGNAPFQQLSQLGGNKLMRGYYQGRFTDNNFAALQTEGRFPLFKRLGGVLFADGGFLGNQQNLLRFNDFKYSYGTGLRYNVNRKDHLNIRLDYALGPKTSGFYFTIGEAF